MISFDRVSKRYDEGHDALREISIEIAQDELVFLTGHSGGRQKHTAAPDHADG